jgi:hypothetical protein
LSGPQFHHRKHKRGGIGCHLELGGEREGCGQPVCSLILPQRVLGGNGGHLRIEGGGGQGDTGLRFDIDSFINRWVLNQKVLESERFGIRKVRNQIGLESDRETERFKSDKFGIRYVLNQKGLASDRFGNRLVQNQIGSRSNKLSEPEIRNQMDSELDSFGIGYIWKDRFRIR